jgi:hypothetical protein
VCPAIASSSGTASVPKSSTAIMLTSTFMRPP